MLERIEELYHEEVSRYIYLTTVLESVGKSSVFNLSLMIFAFDNEMHLKNLRTDPVEIIAKCSKLKGRIESVCAGILEVHEEQKSEVHEEQKLEVHEEQKSDTDSESEIYSNSDSETGLGIDSSSDSESRFGTHSEWLAWEPKESRLFAASVDWSSVVVKFCHRTAKDFFEANSKGKAFVSTHQKWAIDRKLLSAAIRLAKISMCQLKNPRYFVLSMLTGIMEEAFEFERTKDWMPMEFLDHIDQVIAALYLHLHGPSPSSYWFHRWGPSNQAHVFHFQEIGSDGRVKVAADNNQTRPVWFPESFLGVATLYRLYGYTHMKLEKRKIDISAEEIKQLMYCTTTQYSSRRQKRALKKEHRFILQLVSLGAGLGVRPPEILWKYVLLRLYKHVVYDLFEPEVIKPFREMIKAFVDCGVDPFPKLSVFQPIRGVKSGREDRKIYLDFEIDTALAPFMYAVLKDDHNSTWMMSLEESRHSTERQKDNELRFRLWPFYPPRDDDGSPSWRVEPLVVMTKQQAQSLHESIQAVSTTTSFETRQAARFQLGQTISSINDYHSRLLYGDMIDDFQPTKKNWEWDSLSWITINTSKFSEEDVT